MSKVTGLVIFGIGAVIGLGLAPEDTETKTVFIEKPPITKEVVKTKVVHEPPPTACDEVYLKIGDLVEPIEKIGATAGELQKYAQELGIQVFDDDVSEINRTTVKLRLAKDEQDTAVIEVKEALKDIDNRYIECQRAVVEGSD